jgi:two-component system sensor histidine kinase/response regulator
MTPESTTPSRRVLLVEDNAVNRTIATRLLEKRGHVVIAVENGELAVAITATDRFDVVLMDIQMPVMDGLTATAKIREREHATGGHVPIIAVTAHALDDDRRRCLAAGMDDFLPKPIRSSDLFAKVARCGVAPVEPALDAAAM